jgi:tRNA-splicing ligase RtcB
MKRGDKLRSLIALNRLEPEAVRQIDEALALPFLEVLAIMPDCHPGYHLPIGAVALLSGVISPSYVGYDIGCGMCCLKADLDAKEIQGMELDIFEEIYARVPVAFESRGRPLDYPEFRSACGDKGLDRKVASRLNVQLGTLGGGNHFIEIGAASDGALAVTIHSGSRNIGHSIASHYMQAARSEDRDLPPGFLRLGGRLGNAYVRDMDFALEYALENRRIMMRTVLEVLGLPEKLMARMINENHNHALVSSDGAVLHRKGATPAEKDQYGVIPGNMRDGVYVTRGLGNRRYLCSASHGAGRTMSRKQAKKKFKLREFQAAMQGVVARVTPGTLDESPFAYKNLDEVVAMQDGVVVEVADKILPLINIKG